MLHINIDMRKLILSNPKFTNLFVLLTTKREKKRKEGERKAVKKHLFIAAIKLLEINYDVRFIKVLALEN